jgi:hypothetical protein
MVRGRRYKSCYQPAGAISRKHFLVHGPELIRDLANVMVRLCSATRSHPPCRAKRRIPQPAPKSLTKRFNAVLWHDLTAARENVVGHGGTGVADHRTPAGQSLNDTYAAGLARAGIDKHIKGVQETTQVVEMAQRMKAIAKQLPAAFKDLVRVPFFAPNWSTRQRQVHVFRQPPGGIQQMIQLFDRAKRAGYSNNRRGSEAILRAKPEAGFRVRVVVAEIHAISDDPPVHFWDQSGHRCTALL